MARSKKLYHFNYAISKGCIQETRDRLAKKAEAANDLEAHRLKMRYEEIDKAVASLPEPDFRGLVKVPWKTWQILDSATRASR